MIQPLQKMQMVLKPLAIVGVKEIPQRVVPKPIDIEEIPQSVIAEPIEMVVVEKPLTLPGFMDWITNALSKLWGPVTRTQRYKSLVSNILKLEEPSLMDINVSGLKTIQERALAWVWGLKNIPATRGRALEAMSKLPMYQQY
jgi:hypothetical protein